MEEGKLLYCEININQICCLIPVVKPYFLKKIKKALHNVELAHEVCV